jgi:hypothetical protein
VARSGREWHAFQIAFEVPPALKGAIAEYPGEPYLEGRLEGFEENGG